MTNELKIGIKELNISPENFADLVVLAIKGEISSRIAKDLIVEMHKSGADSRQIVEEKGWNQISTRRKLRKLSRRLLMKILRLLKIIKRQTKHYPIFNRQGDGKIKRPW